MNRVPVVVVLSLRNVVVNKLFIIYNKEIMEKEIVELGVISYKEVRERVNIISFGLNRESNFTLEDMPKKCIFPKETAHKFIIALTSGCYSQIEMYLASVNKTGKTSYCVYGVLLHILGVPTMMLSRYMTTKEQNTTRELTGTIRKLNEENVWRQFSDSITYMNDYGGRSFSEIAEWIKRNIETI